MSKNKGSFIDRILFSTDDYDEKHHQAKAVSESRHRKNVAIPRKTKSGLVSNIQSLFTKKKSSKGSKSKAIKMKGGAKRKNKRSTKKRKNMRRMRRMRRTRRRRKR